MHRKDKIGQGESTKKFKKLDKFAEAAYLFLNLTAHASTSQNNYCNYYN